jgi:LTXXQ motif family protein
MAAPPPRMAAPAPHFSAPARVAAPHYAAPARTFSPSPRSFAARPAPHVAAPHIAAPNRSYAQMPHGRAPQIQAQRFSPTSRQATIARTARELNRNAATKPPEVTKNVASKPSEVTKNALTSKPGPADNRTRQDLADKGQPLTGAKPGEGQTANFKGQDRLKDNLKGPNNLKGQNQAAINRQSEAQQKLALADAARARVEQARKTPILKNPVFASQSPRAAGATLSNWTFRGHFAQSAFLRDRDRHHHRHIGIVLGFVGAAFWPYAYDDFVDYTFAPYAYDTFWPYAFDDVYAGIYGGYAPEYYAPVDAYAYAGSPSSERAYSRASRYPTTRANAPLGGGSARVCSGEAQGLTDFSIQKISDQVQPTQNQQALLDDLKDATLKAVQILQTACPTDLPSTATGRLSAMRARVDAMLQAVQTVRPALEKFYASLNDEQRVRFNAMDQGEQQQAAQAQGGDLDRLCKGQDSAQGRLPIDRIERTLGLSPSQQDGLRALDDATVKAGEILKSQCQSAATLTPTGRLAAMAERLTAMSKALETTQAALTNFYGSLSNEQKAQFDRINARRA